MSKSQKHREEVILKAYSFGWQRDRWGHLKKRMKSGRLMRLKIQKTSLRLEVQVKMYDGKNQWVRKTSDYFKNIKVEDHSIVMGGIRIKCPREMENVS